MKRSSYPAAAEAPRTQTEQIAKALHDARVEAVRMTGDSDFRRNCRKKGIDPNNDMDTGRYWDNFANYASRKLSAPSEGPQDPLVRDATQLFAVTPQLLYKQTSLDKSEGHKKRLETRVGSNFNARVRTFAERYSDTPVSVLHKGILSMASVSIEIPALRSSSSEFISESLKGAQTEIGFGQALRYTGRQYWPATPEEDIIGFDYIVAGKETDDPLFVDVKSSTYKMHGQEFNWRDNNTVMMVSPFNARDFNDRFFLPEATAAAHGLAVDTMLGHVERQRPY